MTTTTLMAGWEHHFTMAQALDPMGAVVGQRIAYVPGGVGGLGRSYFEVPSLPVAENYRVSVWDYTWFQGPQIPEVMRVSRAPALARRARPAARRCRS